MRKSSDYALQESAYDVPLVNLFSFQDGRELALYEGQNLCYEVERGQQGKTSVVALRAQ
jgi:hypothetical protein